MKKNHSIVESLERIVFPAAGKVSIMLLGVLIFLGVSYASNPSKLPRVTEVHFKTEHGRVFIDYNLAGDQDLTYRIRLVLKKANDPSYIYIPRTISGDVGVGKFSGIGREIVWSMNQEFPFGLPGSDFYFVVSAEQVEDKSGPSLFAMIGAGVAVAAAAVTYFLVEGSSSRTAPASSSLPPPPGRP